MPIPHSNTLLFIVFGGMIAYAIIGAVILRRWQRGRVARRPISAYADPEGWVAFWLPLLIVFETFALGGGLFTVAMMLVALPADQMQYPVIGGGGGLIVVALCLAGLDIAWVRRVRALGRQQPASAGR